MRVDDIIVEPPSWRARPSRPPPSKPRPPQPSAAAPPPRAVVQNAAPDGMPPCAADAPHWARPQENFHLVGSDSFNQSAALPARRLRQPHWPVQDPSQSSDFLTTAIPQHANIIDPQNSTNYKKWILKVQAGRCTTSGETSRKFSPRR